MTGAEPPRPDVAAAAGEDGYDAFRLRTSTGETACRYYAAPGGRRGVIWVGGAGGGWDTPAEGLYPRLCRELTAEGIASLRVRFRDPASLDRSVVDVLAGVRYLEGNAVEAIGLVGHSFGGAVVIQAAAAAPAVRTVVTLATQSYGARRAGELAPRCSLLLVHGTADRVLPASSSEYVHALAREPKRLVLYEGAGHGLDEVAEPLAELVCGWLVDTLSATFPAAEAAK